MPLVEMDSCILIPLSSTQNHNLKEVKSFTRYLFLCKRLSFLVIFGIIMQGD